MLAHVVVEAFEISCVRLGFRMRWNLADVDVVPLWIPSRLFDVVPENLKSDQPEIALGDSIRI